MLSIYLEKHGLHYTLTSSDFEIKFDIDTLSGLNIYDDKSWNLSMETIDTFTVIIAHDNTLEVDIENDHTKSGTYTYLKEDMDKLYYDMKVVKFNLISDLMMSGLLPIV